MSHDAAYDSSAPKGRTVVDQAASRLREGIENGLWLPGARLPSIRELATQFEVSANSVVAAIGLLEAEQLVDRRARRGVFVCGENGPREEHRPLGVYSELASMELAADQWGGRVAGGCLTALRAGGIAHQVLEAPRDDPDREKLRQQIRSKARDYSGFIVPWAAWSESTLKDLVQTIGSPVIKVGRHSHACRHNYVSIDHFEAGNLAGLQVQRRRPGPFLVLSSAASHDFPRRQLILGFIDGLQRSRQGLIQVAVLPVAHDSIDSGYEAMAGYLQTAPPPRAVFGIGDAVPIGAMQAAIDAGHEVPQQIAFIGSAGLEIVKACRPTLSHVRQPMERLGQEACAMAKQLIRSGQLWLPGRDLHADWQPGGSTAQNPEH